MTTFRLLIGPDQGADAGQLALRTVLLFALGILFIRIAGRRTFAQYTPLDILVALIVGSNISRIMLGKAAFFPGLAATLVLVVLHRLLAFAALRWRFLSWLVKAPAIRLIDKGVIDEEGLRRVGFSRGDLEEALRLERIDDPADVDCAMLEAGGRLSAIPRKTLTARDLEKIEAAAVEKAAPRT